MGRCGERCFMLPPLYRRLVPKTRRYGRGEYGAAGFGAAGPRSVLRFADSERHDVIKRIGATQVSGVPIVTRAPRSDRATRGRVHQFALTHPTASQDIPQSVLRAQERHGGEFRVGGFWAARLPGHCRDAHSARSAVGPAWLCLSLIQSPLAYTPAADRPQTPAVRRGDRRRGSCLAGSVSIA
jgi:hypothetical protein